MTSFRIFKDVPDVDYLRALGQMVVPMINPLTAENVLSGVGGGIAYNAQSQQLLYNNGSSWIPLANAGTGSQSDSYALILSNSQNILPFPNPPTVLTGWTSTPSPPYHDNTTSWNLVTGVYTATVPQTFSVEAFIAWSANVSNIGKRTLQIIYKPFLGAPMIAKEVTTQAEPDTTSETPQSAAIFLSLNAGDQVWVEVTQTSAVTLTIAGGNHTSLSGVRID